VTRSSSGPATSRVGVGAFLVAVVDVVAEAVGVAVVLVGVCARLLGPPHAARHADVARTAIDKLTCATPFVLRGSAARCMQETR
jgi:hypothetical protein